MAIGPGLSNDGVQKIIDGRDRLIVPDLINAHYHSHDTLCRGMFEELPLEIWLLFTLRWAPTAATKNSAPAP